MSTTYAIPHATETTTIKLKAPVRRKTCKSCKGKGQLAYSRGKNADTGRFIGKIWIDCPPCKGKGYTEVKNVVDRPNMSKRDRLLRALVREVNHYTHGHDYMDDLVDLCTQVVLCVGSAHGPGRRSGIKLVSEVLKRNIVLYADEAVREIIADVRKELNRR